jgi:hypothetical protein
VIEVGLGVAEDKSTETFKDTCDEVFDLMFKLKTSA